MKDSPIPQVPVSAVPRSSDRGTAGLGKPGENRAASLSELVAARRAELGLSLRALQERSGVHYSHVSKVESGQDMVGLNGLAGLSLGLEVPLAELLRAAGIRANLGLPSFASYLDAVTPDLAPGLRRELEAAFERLTGVSVAALPSPGSATKAREVSP